MTYFYFFFPFFFNLFLRQINCIVGINSFVDTSSLNLANVNTTLLADNGQSAYISFINGSTYTINKYSILNGVPNYVNSFIDPSNRVNPDKLLIYSNYIIGYQTNGLSFNVWYTYDFSFYGNFLINQNICSLNYVMSKAIFLYITCTGDLKYILQSDFLGSNAKNLILSSSLPNPIMSISSDQNYVAIACATVIYTYVYQLTNYLPVLTFDSTNGGISSMIWRFGTELILFTYYNCVMYRIDVSSGNFNTTTIMFVPTCSNASWMTLTLINSIYLYSDQVVGAFNYVFDPMHSAMFSYSFITLQITYLMNMSSFLRPTSYTNQIDNSYLFSNNNATNLYFGNISATCQSPLVYDMSIYQCVNLTANVVNSTNVTNFTNSTNITDAMNITNTTNATNTTNDTYIINLTNTTNNTSFTNTTNGTITTNNTNFTNSTNISASNFTSISNLAQVLDSTNPIILNFQSFLNDTLRSPQLAYINSIPGSRTVLRPIFTFFVNFDDLWLYVYHQREYNEVVNQVFNSVQLLQSQKWNLLPIRTIWQFLGLQSNDTINQFSSKQTRTSSKFYEIQQNSNGFIVNTLTFLCSNVFLMLVIFIILRLLFYLLFNYRISILFRNYSFWLYFLIVVLEGNLQYLSYLFSFELQNFFSSNYINKFGLAFAVALFFVLFIFSVTAYPIVQYYHGRLVRYFVQDMKLSEFTAIYMAIQMGYRNILLGFLHSILNQYYFIKIGSLMAVQIIYLSFSIVLITKQMIFQNHLKVWMNIIAGTLRILLIFTFFIDYQNIEIDLTFVHVYIFYFYSYEMCISIIIQFIRLILEAKIWIFNQKKPKKNSQLKQMFNFRKAIEQQKKKTLNIIFLDQTEPIFNSRLAKIEQQQYENKDLIIKDKEEENNSDKKVNELIQKGTKIMMYVKYKMRKSNQNQFEKNPTINQLVTPKNN